MSSGAARELLEVLDRETELVKDLVGILQEDQQRIIAHDVAGLERSNLLKEERVLQFQSLEHLRARLVESIGRELALPADEVRVSRICPLLGAEGAALRASADRLRAVVAGLAELIAISRGFLEQSILGVRSLLALIHSLRAPEPGTYDFHGRLASAPDPGAVALRREA